MTRQRSFKARVRTRMDKTGESYAAARRTLLATRPPSAPAEADSATLDAAAADTPAPDPTGADIATPDTATEGTVAQGTATGSTVAQGTATPGDANLDPAAADTAAPDTTTPGTAAEGTAEPGDVSDVAAVRGPGTRRLTERLTDPALLARTGRSWAEWFALLDAWGATGRTHAEIARRLHEEHGVDGWSAQSITGGYEQERGLRAPGQQPDGTFRVSAGRTIACSAERAVEAFTDPVLRARWLPEPALGIRSSRPGRSVTADWPGGERLVIGVDHKGDGRCRLAVQHQRLADSATAEARREHWRAALTRLKELLES
ncbi:MAG TPA: hypothetical protein VGD67_07950 [Pseudonocardiaceae bacterium]